MKPGSQNITNEPKASCLLQAIQAYAAPNMPRSPPHIHIHIHTHTHAPWPPAAVALATCACVAPKTAAELGCACRGDGDPAYAFAACSIASAYGALQPPPEKNPPIRSQHTAPHTDQHACRHATSSGTVRLACCVTMVAAWVSSSRRPDQHRRESATGIANECGNWPRGATTKPRDPTRPTQHIVIANTGPRFDATLDELQSGENRGRMMSKSFVYRFIVLQPGRIVLHRPLVPQHQGIDHGTVPWVKPVPIQGGR